MSPTAFPIDLINTTVDAALTRRHRGVSKADARQEAYLAVLEAQAVDPEADVAEVAYRAVVRHVAAQTRRTGSGPVASLTPYWEGVKASSQTHMANHGQVMADTWADRNCPPAASAEDAYLDAVDTATTEEAEDALAGIDPVVATWLTMIVVGAENAYTAGLQLGIGTNATDRLLKAAGLNERGIRRGTHGRGYPVNLQGLVGLDARGLPIREDARGVAA